MSFFIDCIVVKSEQKIELYTPKESIAYKYGFLSKVKEYNFSHIFNETTSQEKLFKKAALPLVKSILNGKNAICLTYGYLNTGKVRLLNRGNKSAS